MNRREILFSALGAATALSASGALAGQALGRTVTKGRYEPMDGVNGLVEKGWEPVADVLRANFKEGRDLGASCCVYVDGKPVVDIWGGLADRATKKPWEKDTVTVVASTTKGATAICAHMLVQRGQLDLEAPVTRYWPEFGQAGKQDMPVRYLLSHQAGLPFVDKQPTFEEAVAWKPVIHALEIQKPLWTPGTEHLYHAETFGYLVGELIRRVTGKTAGTFFQEEIARPLKLLAWIGTPEKYEPLYAQREYVASAKSPEEMVNEFASIVGVEPAVAAALMKDLYGPDTAFQRAGKVGSITPEIFFSRAYRAAEFPAGNLLINGRGLARMYAATVSKVDGVRLLQPETVAKATMLQTDRSRMYGVPDALQPYTKNLFKMSFGFWRPAEPANPMLGPSSFGHPGSGGSLGCADPESRVGFGYVPNFSEAVLIDTRARDLTAAVRKCLGQ